MYIYQQIVRLSAYIFSRPFPFRFTNDKKPNEIEIIFTFCFLRK